LAISAIINALMRLVVRFRKLSVVPLLLLGILLLAFGAYFMLTGTYVFYISGKQANPWVARGIGLLVIGVSGLILLRLAGRVFSGGPAVLIQGDTIRLHAAFTPRAVTLRRNSVMQVTRIYSVGRGPIGFRAFRVLVRAPGAARQNKFQLVIDKCVDTELSHLREQLIAWTESDAQ